MKDSKINNCRKKPLLNNIHGLFSFIFPILFIFTPMIDIISDDNNKPGLSGLGIDLIIGTDITMEAIETSHDTHDLTSAESTHIIYFTGPIKQNWKERVINQGVELVGYFPDFGYISKFNMNSNTRTKLNDLSFIRDIQPYSPKLKFPPNFFEADHLDPGTTSSLTRSKLVLMIHLGGGGDDDSNNAKALEELHQRITELGGEIISTTGDKLIIQIDNSKIETLTTFDEVLWLEHAPEYRYFNDVASGILDPTNIRSELGLDGAGQIVTVCDTGLDNGSYSNLHLDLREQLIYAYAFGQLLVLSLYQRYKKERDSFKPGYIKILEAGGSKAPVAILSESGIDISSKKFWQGGFDVIDSMVKELEDLPIE